MERPLPPATRPLPPTTRPLPPTTRPHPPAARRLHGHRILLRRTLTLLYLTAAVTGLALGHGGGVTAVSVALLGLAVGRTVVLGARPAAASRTGTARAGRHA
ncbi:hypothetical protein [Streptomyces longwoodensis]|uniref:hypothetical protein n=1 Tax=Streptomyces longwoodensis TaxID=68231 RepID=UPI002257B1B1|nr:hypothetical protein [Streptomyces longwoodensis]MCX5000526.1 hypothetical protein [Streptomyces longwoodensis]